MKVKRGETPFYAFLRRIAYFLLYPTLPVPGFLLPVFRGFYLLHFGIWRACRTMLVVFYNTPLFRGRCSSAGKGLYVFILPHVMGPTRIHVGNNLKIFGKMAISSGLIHEDPTLIIKDNVTIGHMVSITVNQEVSIEDNVYIAGSVRISDNDGHPLDPDLRKQGLPPALEEIKPVRIGRNAWLGEGCYIRKGVTIGEGAVVGANSVVLQSVAPYSIVVGNPARVVGFAEPKVNTYKG